jgi:3-deoxy-manno-octulosonate cytidylyltransferase (CMP-KDO synthetase)
MMMNKNTSDLINKNNLKMNKVAIIIPSRIGSTRLSRKPLIEIEGKPMLIWCAEQAKNSNSGDVYIACDCHELAQLCESYGYRYILTDPGIPTGSDRVYIASKSLGDYEIIVNLQGDMPKIKPSTIKLTVDALLNDTEKKFDIMSAITTFSDEAEKADINNVSAIVSHIGVGELQPGDVMNSLYFTRTSHPYPTSVYKHIGIYGYRAEALEKFVSLPQSRLEIEEKLEQLRALENGLKIGCVFVNDHVISLDSPDDLKRLV